MSAPLRPPVPVGTATEVENRTGPVLTDSAFDQGTRWLLGERLDDLYEERCARTPDDLAVDAPGTTLTFAELDARANQLARHLRPCWPNSWVGPACRDRAVRPRAP